MSSTTGNFQNASTSRALDRGETLVQVFSSLGHGFMHLLAAYYYVVALRLEREWGVGYAELLRLWTIGAALVGLMALPAGWLSDRWSPRGMMVVFFLGLGASAMLCGAANGPRALQAALALLGAFAAIYHPVGLPWLVRHARQRGRALGVNGIFGSLGVASAGLVAGALSDSLGWRAAFVLPGVASVAAGVTMTWCIIRGWIPELPPLAASPGTSERRGDRRLLWILVATMTSGALIYQATQAALPKALALTLGDWLGGSTLGVGALIGLIYGVSSLTQVAAGQMADRFPLRSVYLVTLFGQAPVLWAMAMVMGSGWSFVSLATLSVVVNTGALPAENLLLSESTPRDRQGLAFGLRFVLVFGVTPLSLWFVSAVAKATGGFHAVFVSLAGLAALTGVVALGLRRTSRV